jgi:arginase family enzyme
MVTTTPHPARAVFTLRIAGKPGTAGIHALRFLLKRLLRQHGFIALDLREDAPATDAAPNLANGIAAQTKKKSSPGNFDPPF